MFIAHKKANEAQEPALQQTHVMRWVEFENMQPNADCWCLIAHEAGFATAWWNNESREFEGVDDPFLNPPDWWAQIVLPSVA